MRWTVKKLAILALDSLLPIYEEREARNIIRILFEDLFGVTNLASEKEFLLVEEFSKCIDRLAASEPIQYVTGQADFYGYQFKVNNDVLIPRPETEELVHWILQDVKRSQKQLDVLDIGLGSGCIALTIKKNNQSLRVFGVEYSLDALNVARVNSRRLGAPMTFFNFNFLDKGYWPEMGQFDIIVSNPPYIAQEDKGVMVDNVLLYEPHMALFAGEDPLCFYKAIKLFSKGHLKEGGVVYLEIHEDYATDVGDIFKSEDSKVEIKKDLQGKDRMMKVLY